MHELADELLGHLKAIWRYRWYAMGVAWIVALGGWLTVWQLPDRYEADARVYVDTQSILRPLLSGLAVQPNLDEMVLMMSRTLISRPNLEKVIRMADLDIGLHSEQEREQLVAGLTRKLALRSAGRENLYTISFVDEDPHVAKRVVESLLRLFMEGSLSDKRKDSDSALRFIDEQLESYREKLVAAENAITAFKRRHMGLLPEGGQGYFTRLVDAKTALSQVALELKEAENSRDTIKQQLASFPELRSLPDATNASAGGNTDTELDVRIRALEERLDTLRLSYTEQHPDIVAIVPMIAQLKERREAERKLLREQQEAEAKLRGPDARVAQPTDPAYLQLAASLTTAEADVAAKKTRVAEYARRYADLQAAANAVPQIEAEYTQLTRDYDVNKARYDELLKRRESAQITGDMEVTDAAMGFRVIDPPQVPLAPVAPDRPSLMTMVLLAALLAGIGIAFLIGQMRPTINDERRLREVSGLAVLGTVAMAWTEAQKKRRARWLGAFVLSFLSLLSAYAAIMAMLMLTVSRA
jgi:polysaccharide chain length determinant protein (PEP-CTERM system associated)